MIEPEVVKLIQLDCKLRTILQEIKNIGLMHRRALLHKIKPFGGPIRHFEAAASIDFYPPDRIYEYEPGRAVEYACLASFNLRANFLRPNSENHWEGDNEFPHDPPASMRGLSPSWLLHELYRNSNGTGSLSIEQILGLEKVEVMISSHTLLEMNLRDGKWNVNEPDWDYINDC